MYRLLLLLFPVLAVSLSFTAAQTDDSGCAATLSHTSGLTTATLQVGVLERTYQMYIPPQAAAAQPLPLMLALHGFASTSDEFMTLTDFNSLAAEVGFVVVYPQATESPSVWFGGTGVLLRQDDPRDLMFMTRLLDEVLATTCVDAQRVYAVGFSMGGGMVYRMACQLGDRIAAIATVAGAFSAIPGGCQPAHPMPVIAIHGLDDPVVPFEGLGIFLPSATTALNGWVTRNHCDQTQVAAAVNYTDGAVFDRCADGVVVRLITVPGVGHTWPGTKVKLGNSRQPPDTLDASRVIWDFIARYRLPDENSSDTSGK